MLVVEWWNGIETDNINMRLERGSSSQTFPHNLFPSNRFLRSLSSSRPAGSSKFETFLWIEKMRMRQSFHWSRSKIAKSSQRGLSHSLIFPSVILDASGSSRSLDWTSTKEIILFWKVSEQQSKNERMNIESFLHWTRRGSEADLTPTPFAFSSQP